MNLCLPQSESQKENPPSLTPPRTHMAENLLLAKSQTSAQRWKELRMVRAENRNANFPKLFVSFPAVDANAEDAVTRA